MEAALEKKLRNLIADWRKAATNAAEAGSKQHESQVNAAVCSGMEWAAKDCAMQFQQLIGSEAQTSDPTQEQCIYCGPICYRGAAHWARKEDGSLHAERNPPNLHKMSRLILRALLMERFKRNPTDSEMDTHWKMYAREVEAKR